MCRDLKVITLEKGIVSACGMKRNSFATVHSFAAEISLLGWLCGDVVYRGHGEDNLVHNYRANSSLEVGRFNGRDLMVLPFPVGTHTLEVTVE